MISRNRSGRYVTGFVAGALLGAAGGLLFATQPGRETRHSLKHRTGHYVGDLRERFKTNSVPKVKEEPVDAAA